MCEQQDRDAVPRVGDTSSFSRQTYSAQAHTELSAGVAAYYHGMSTSATILAEFERCHDVFYIIFAEIYMSCKEGTFLIK